jgi:NitT/TauT family transport system substrate-binding protein
MEYSGRTGVLRPRVLAPLLLALCLLLGCTAPSPPVPTTAPAAAPTRAPQPTSAQPAAQPTTAQPTSAQPDTPTAPPATTQPAYHPTPLSSSIHVKVTDNQVTSMVAIYLAYDRGYFTDEGLDVELQISNDRSQDVALLATNQVQFIVSLPDPVLFNAIARGIDIRVLASATVNGPTDRPATFLVRSDLLDGGQFKGPADARGLNIAVGAPSSSYYVETYLGRAGLGLEDVKIVQLPGPEAIAAFKSKAIDAAWEAEPIATSLNVQGLARTVVTTGELVPGSVAGALAVAPQFAQGQPEATQRFVNAFLRGARDYYYGYMQNGDRGPIIQTLINHTTVKDASLYSQLGLPSYDPNCSTDPSPSWSAFQDFYVRRGIEERKVDISKYVDFSFVNHALEVLGRTA